LKSLFWKEQQASNNFLNVKNYDYYKKVANETFSEIFFVLPHDVNIKKKYLIEKNYALKGITRYIQHCRQNLQLDDALIYETIKKVDWTLNFEYWKKYGATLSRKGSILFSGGEGGITSVYDCLLDTLGYRELQTTLEDM
jgi:DNA sulfur modification protein DndB